MISNILADYLQIWGFEQNHAVFTDASVGAVFELSPVDVSCSDDEYINQLADRLGHFLNGLPSGFRLQFAQDIKGGNHDVISRFESQNTSDNLLSKKITTERAKRLFDMDQAGELPAHRLYLVIRTAGSNSRSICSWWPERAKSIASKADGLIQKQRMLLESLCKDLTAGLEALELSPRQLSASEVFSLVYEQWNPTRDLPPPAWDPEDIRPTCHYTDAAVSDQGFTLGSMHHRILSLKNMPDITIASMAQTLRNLAFDSRLLVTIKVPDQQSEMDSLKTQRRMAFSAVHGSQSGAKDLEGSAKLDDLETLLDHMITQGEKVFHVGVNLILRARSESELNAQVNDSIMRFRELSGAELMQESYAAFDIFSECCLPNASISERTKRMKTSELADFLPVYGPWTGHPTPEALLRARSGSLVSFDPFAKELTNANQIVSGGSGSGKSFMVNVLMLQMLKSSPQIFIIDIGGSYQKLCRTLDGQYIPLGVDGKMSFNPFDLGPGQTKPDNYKVKFLVSLIEMMTKESNETGLPRLWRAEIEDAIYQSYQKSTSPDLSNLKRELENHFDPEIKRVGRTLKSWVGASPYGQFVDRSTSISLDRPIVCFDLKGLDGHPDLQAVCLFIITDFVWREVQKNTSQRKFLIMDECWRLLESDAGASFTQDVFRTFRKYYASAIAISQNIDDFARSKVATAILPNTSIRWILRQKGADKSRLKDVLDLNDNELSLIDSLRQERGIYSEAFLMAQDNRAVVSIESTPLEYWLATTDPRETSFIDKEKAKHPEKCEIEILEQLSHRFPHGLMGKEVGIA